MDTKYSIKLILNDQNLDGPKEGKYPLTVIIFDPNQEKTKKNKGNGLSDKEESFQGVELTNKTNRIAYYPATFSVPYIKRNGRAFIKILTTAPIGGGQIALQVTNTTFNITWITKGSGELIPY